MGFGHTVAGQSTDFRNDVFQCAAPLPAPGHRNDAERAPIIAAALDGSKGSDTLSGAPRRDVLVVLPRLEFHVHVPGAVGSGGQELGKPAVSVGAHDQIHVWRLVE